MALASLPWAAAAAICRVRSVSDTQMRRIVSTVSFCRAAAAAVLAGCLVLQSLAAEVQHLRRSQEETLSP